MVTCAFSPSRARSATATYLWLGDTAIAVMPSLFSARDELRLLLCVEDDDVVAGRINDGLLVKVAILSLTSALMPNSGGKPP